MSTGEKRKSDVPHGTDGRRSFNSRLRHSNQAYLRARQNDSEHPPIRRRIAFVLLEHFSMMAFTGAVDAIVTANLLSRNPLYRFQAVSLEGGSVLSDLGISIAADGELRSLDATDLDMLIVCGGYRSDLDPPRAVLDLRAIAQGDHMGALWNGSCVLAQAGCSTATHAVHRRAAQDLRKAALGQAAADPLRHRPRPHLIGRRQQRAGRCSR